MDVGIVVGASKGRKIRSSSKNVSYLRGKYNSRLALDTTYTEIDYASSKNHKYVDFYGNFKEAISPNLLELRGKDVDLIIYVDRYHAGDNLTRRSRMKFPIYMNKALIQWISNKQPTIET